MTLCSLCALEMTATPNGDYCKPCGTLTFGPIKIKQKKVRLYRAIKKFGETYSAHDAWSSVKYSGADNVVGHQEVTVSVDE